MQTHSSNTQSFQRDIGKIGVGKDRNKGLPYVVIKKDGTIATDKKPF